METNQHDSDEPLTPLQQAEHFLVASSRSNTKLVTVRRADLRKALEVVSESSEARDHLTTEAGKADTKYVSVRRAFLLRAMRSVVERAATPTNLTPTDENGDADSGEGSGS